MDVDVWPMGWFCNWKYRYSHTESSSRDWRAMSRKDSIVNRRVLESLAQRVYTNTPLLDLKKVDLVWCHRDHQKASNQDDLLLDWFFLGPNQYNCESWSNTRLLGSMIRYWLVWNRMFMFIQITNSIRQYPAPLQYSLYQHSKSSFSVETENISISLDGDRDSTRQAPRLRRRRCGRSIDDKIYIHH